jgi:hypothetical protein
MDTWLNRNLLPDELIGTASDDTLWERVREVRNALLLETDWIVLSDVVLSNKDAWLEYRQALRDMTNVDNPFDVIIPTKPIEGGV